MPSTQFRPRAPILPSGKGEMKGCQDRPLPKSNGLGLAGTDDPATIDNLKATQHVLVDGKFKLEDLPPGIIPLPRIDGYDLLGILGRGGMGVVYKAREIKLQRLVALKMILAGSHAGPNELQRFQTEARAVAKLQHPNIVQIYDINEQDEHWYFSLEFIEGGNLTSKIGGTPQRPRKAAQMVEVLARAMYYAHEHNIVHRDLKPANILLTADDIPKITDFGVAKQLDSEQGQTRSGAIVGTPSYMAPEQARGQTKVVGPAADIYSLGALLYEMLTGRPPFKGETPVDTLFQVAYEEPSPPSRLQPQVPHDLEVICLKCLEKDPDRRYLTAQALANDLARFLADEPILARPLTAGELSWRWVKRHKAKTAMAAALLIAIAGVGAGVIRSQNSNQHRVKEKEKFTLDLAKELKTIVEGKAWETTPRLVSDIRANLASDSELAPIRTEVEEELQVVDTRFKARALHRDFLARFDDSMFELASLLGNEQILDQGQSNAWNALSLVGIRPGKSDFRPSDYQLTYDEKKDIELGCYELLLTLAELAKGSDSLAILDLTEPLPVKSRTYHLLRAKRLEELHESNEALRERDLANKQPMSALDYFLSGNHFYSKGNVRKAGEEYAKALQLRPDFFWARYYLAYCDIRLGEPARARDNLTACARDKTNIVWIYLMRGYAEGQLKNFESAEKDFQTALALNPKENEFYVLYNNRGVMRLDQKERFDEGMQDLQNAAALCPKKYNAFASLADAFARQKKWSDAIEHIDQAIARANEPAIQGTLYRYRARFHSELKDDDAALVDLEKEIAVESEGGVPSAKAYVLRGRIQQKNHRFEEAIRSFVAAQKIQSGSFDALRGRAETLFEMKNYHEAVQAFDDLTRHSAGSSQDYKLRGLAKSHLGDHQGAAEDYSRALDLEIKAADSEKKASNLAWLRTHRANAYLACQADRPALADFEEIVRYEPKNAPALCGRGLARVRLGQIDSGVQDAQYALRLGLATSRVCYGCGRIYAQAAAKLNLMDRKDRQTVAKTREFEDRAVDLIDQALTLLPSNERAAFWQDTVSKDSCLVILRRTLPFSKLEEKYAPRMKTVKMAGSVPGVIATAQ